MNTKQATLETIKSKEAMLIDLSHRIHANPELGFEEIKASTWISEMLSLEGFNVEQGVAGLPTAIQATIGDGDFHIGICAEYDSLPGVGHACGHNIIAAAAVGAAIGLRKMLGHMNLKVTVFGTPAEEIGDAGGKILMLDRGTFEGIDACMMVHPGPVDVVKPTIIAASRFNVHYTGKEAHASGFPELGINAGDALTVAQTALGLLRQHIKPTDRINGIITKGGEAFNIIPAHTSAQYMVRAETLDQLEDIYSKVKRCFEAGALATGSSLSIEGGNQPYAHMIHSEAMATSYQQNALSLGRNFPDLGDSAKRSAVSTDMGNVSLTIPSIHPFIGLGSFPIVNHQPEFTAYCATAEADRAVIDGAVAMAWTVVDLATDSSLRENLTL